MTLRERNKNFASLVDVGGIIKLFCCAKIMLGQIYLIFYMKLYHGSKNRNLNAIQKMQAQTDEGIEVPEDELKEGIYLTPNYEYALAMAIRPNGVTYINDETKTIEFENPELFLPESDVYIYEVEISENEAKQIDKNQYVIEGLNEIKPIAQYVHKAKEIEKYYELKNWKPETKNEIISEFKIKK